MHVAYFQGKVWMEIANTDVFQGLGGKQFKLFKVENNDDDHGHRNHDG